MLTCLLTLAAAAPLLSPQSIEAVPTGQVFATVPQPHDRFGAAIALWGDTLAVGVPGDDEAGSDAGAVYVFVRTASGWARQAKLLGSQPSDGREFGIAVSLHEDTLAVGTQWNCGSAYAFRRSGSTWTEEALFQVPNAENNCSECTLNFGTRVSVFGDALAVGESELSGNCAPGAYIYRRSGSLAGPGTWTLEQSLSSLEYSSGAFIWPRALALSGDSLLVAGDTGVSHDDEVVVRQRLGTLWPHETFLVHPDGVPWWFVSLALHADTAVVGFALDSNQGGANAGACFVFVREGGTWSLQQRLLASDAAPGDRFGEAVTVHGDTLIASDRPSAPGAQPSLRVFRRSGVAWAEEGRLTNTGGLIPAGFVLRAAAHQQSLAVGAPWDASFGAQSGTVRAFELVRHSSFCDASDGSLAACPCANPGAPDSGCDVAQGTGGVRLALADVALVPAPVATLAGTGFAPAGQATIIPIRSSTLDPATPVVFGNGLRCVGVPVVRLAATQANEGSSTHSVPHDAGAGAFHYQLWFRDNPASFCTPAAFNLSNGLTIEWP